MGSSGPSYIIKVLQKLQLHEIGSKQKKEQGIFHISNV